MAGGTADAHIHLIEDQRRSGGGLCGDYLNRQTDTRQFTARGDLVKGAGRLAGVRANEKLHLFQTVRTRFVVKGSQADRKSTRLNSSHVAISYAVFCLKNKSEQM